MRNASLTTKMPVLKSAKLPATPKAKVPDLRPFKRFVVACDLVVESYDELSKMLSNPNSAMDSSSDIAMSRTDHEDRVAQCRDGLARFDPQHRYADDGLNVEFIADRLSFTMSLTPYKADVPEGFALGLVAKVQAFEDLNWLVLESACQELEDTNGFIKNVPELLNALNKHAALWRRRREAIEDLLDRCDETITVLWEAEAKKRDEGIIRQRAAVFAVQERIISGRKRGVDACADLVRKIDEARERQVELSAKLEQAIADMKTHEAELSAALREEKGKLRDLEQEDAEAINYDSEGRRPRAC